ncbi:hypothetical protein SAMN05216559_0093 [Halomicrobium zhouii]|uniref:PGF-CTERM protein n=1 Tax=Halomicrobium zhouii TaxID=767519 RepID=A0A1I6K2P8_9EURY|nr:hypothetical protein [Halomicrobium zhouii]SFR85467.1 hypothetical protein SAMN05216559_0093 [Halomicrobium zhouii]
MSDPPPSSQFDDSGTAYSRRTVLRAGGAAVGTVAASGVAAAQNETGTGEAGTDETTADGTAASETPSRVTTTGVTLEQEDIEGDLVGMWIHVGRPVEPVQASIADQCDAVDWGDEDTLTYDVTLFDRRADQYEQRTQLYLPRRAEIGGGDLFIINDEIPCESGYVAVELEQIGARNVDAGTKPGEGITETGAATEAGGAAQGPSGGAGPGFGLFAAAGGLLGGGWLLNRAGEENGDGNGGSDS